MIRWMVWQIRSAFCKHEWQYAETKYSLSNSFEVVESGTKVSATCSKCGWHRKYKKF